MRLAPVPDATSLARGYSGVREEVVDGLLALWNRGVIPIIPCQGSVGASGDLAPLAHMSLPLYVFRLTRCLHKIRAIGHELLDQLDDLEVLVLDLLALEGGKPGEAEIEDGLRLDLAEPELRHQVVARVLGRVGRTDQRDDRVDVLLAHSDHR